VTTARLTYASGVVHPPPREVAHDRRNQRHQDRGLDEAVPAAGGASGQRCAGRG
jgi:hypothetical protein